MSALTEFICSPLFVAPLHPYPTHFPFIADRAQFPCTGQPVMRACMCVCVGNKQIYVVLLAEIGFLAASSCTFALSAVVIVVAVVLFSFVWKREGERGRKKRMASPARCTTQLTHLFPLLSLQRVILFHDLSSTAKGTFVFLLGALKVATSHTRSCPLPFLLAISVN